MIGENRALSLDVEADNSTVSPNDAVSIGLIVTEAVINSLKHAYSADSKNGRILVSYEARGHSWILDITDNGTGKSPVEPAARKAGLGPSIVSALAHQLDARVDIESVPGGTSVKIIHLDSVEPTPQAA